MILNQRKAGFRLIFPIAMALFLEGCISPLVDSAARGDKDKVDVLLSQGMDVNSFSNGMSPLSAAAAHGQNGMINLLLGKGADVNSRGRDGWPPLLAAIFNRHADSAKLLINAGAEVTTESIDIARSYAPEVVPALLEAKKSGERLTQTQLQHAIRAVMEVKAKRPIQKSDVDEPAYLLRARPDDFALVVGIEKYANPEIPEARFAEHDAEAVRSHLIALGYPPRNIKMLSGSRATKAAMTAYLEQWLSSSAVKGSRVFFYFSGHGAPSLESQEAYLVPFDGDAEYLAETAYPLKRLYVKLNSLPADRVVIALDTCFSGMGSRSVLAKGTRPLVTKVADWLLGSGRVAALTASNVEQSAGTTDEHGHGLFTYYMLKGLNGDAMRDGRVSLSGLYRYLRSKVGDEASLQNRSQTPQMLPTGIVDFNLR